VDGVEISLPLAQAMTMKRHHFTPRQHFTDVRMSISGESVDQYLGDEVAERELRKSESYGLCRAPGRIGRVRGADPGGSLARKRRTAYPD
jgi:hypothetical protein